MGRSTIAGITTGIWLSIAAVNGFVAVDQHQKAQEAAARAEAFEQEGRYFAAQQRQEEADKDELSRNLFGGTVILNLGAAAAYGAVTIQQRRREQNQ